MNQPSHSDDISARESAVAKVNEIIFVRTGKELNAGQKRALNALLKLKELGKQHRCGRVCGMPTGSGKTRLAAAFLISLDITGELKQGDAVLVLAPRRVIMKQNELQLKTVLTPANSDSHFEINMPEANYVLGLRWSLVEDLDSLLKNDDTHIDVALITPQLLNLYVRQVGIERLKRVKALILDEVHHTYWGDAISKTIGSVLGLNNIEYVLGLSATPTKESLDQVGEVICPITTDEAMREGILVRGLRIYSTRTEAYANAVVPEILAEAMRKTFGIRGRSSDLPTNEWQVAIIERAQEYAKRIIGLLAKEVREDFLAQRVPKTLVVAANTTEAEELRKHLVEELTALGRKDAEELVAMAHYKIKEADPVDIIEEFKSKREGILVTVNMADMGFDDPNLEVLVIGRPFGTPLGYVQVRGRVLRKPDENAHENNIKLARGYSVLIDFTDAARHETSVADVEQGELAKELSSWSLQSDLQGILGDVPRVHGEVEVGQFAVREIGMEKEKTPVLARPQVQLEGPNRPASSQLLPSAPAQQPLSVRANDRTMNCTTAELGDVAKMLRDQGHSEFWVEFLLDKRKIIEPGLGEIEKALGLKRVAEMDSVGSIGVRRAKYTWVEGQLQTSRPGLPQRESLALGDLSVVITKGKGKKHLRHFYAQVTEKGTGRTARVRLRGNYEKRLQNALSTQLRVEDRTIASHIAEWVRRSGYADRPLYERKHR